MLDKFANKKFLTLFICAVSAPLSTHIAIAQNDVEPEVILEELIVTARKREESLQETPIAISAFNANDIETRNIRDISAIAGLTPNLVFDTAPPVSGNPSGASVFLRGVGQLDFTVNVDPGVGIYVDGVYVSRSVGSVIDLLDVQSVEVLRGPQGTLYGRNTIGGAIQLFSKAPTDEFSGRAKATVGSDNRADILAALSIPITDTFKSKFSVLSQNQDGYVTDGRGVELGDTDSLTGRAQFAWNPSDQFNASLNFDVTSSDENGAPNVPVELFAFDGAFGFVSGVAPTGADDFGTRFNFFAPNCPYDNNNPASVEGNLNCFGNQYNTNNIRLTNSDFPLTKSENDIFGGALTLEYDFDWGQLKSITGYRELDSEFGRDSDHSPLPIFATANIQEQDQFSQEIQLTGSTDNSNWVVGAFYYEETAFEYTQIFLPAFGGPVLLQGIFYNDVENESAAIYGEYTYEFAEKWSATLGARYTDESKFYASDQGFSLLNGNIGGSAVYAGIDPNNPSTNPEQLASFDILDRNTVTTGTPDQSAYVVTLIDEPGQTADISDTNVRATLTYKSGDSSLLYGTYSDGFKSGGFNPRYLAPTSDLRAIEFQPETVKLVELGYKYFGDRFKANLALFQSDYQDIQISADSPTSQGATVTQNAAAATITGLEAEVAYALSSNWLFEGGFGYLDAQYDALGDGVSSSVSLNSRFARIPEFSANIGSSYVNQLDNGAQLTTRIDLSYKGDTEGTVQNDSQAFEDSYALLNASIQYATPNDKWLLTIGGTNLTDEEYTHSVNVNQRLGYAEAVYARGRELYVSAEYRIGE